MPRPISESALFNALMFGGPVEKPSSKTFAMVQPAVEDQAQGGLRVLLAEDVEGNRQVAVELLRRRGHSVVVAANGAEAVELFGTHSPDLILMDSQMPVMGGEEAASRIRALERTTGHRTPIIALTANAMKGDREHSLMIGMDDHVTKPIRSAELYGAIDRVMKGSHPAGSLPAVPL